ncbi:protein NPAT-like isoform X2 [Myxocyprinus asiaticus]|uniref:protein NPAT-like isoform X2 n=1 Tax=Myxocyprinus asiaticus TaxID=70543 RepID=UPI00222208FF|nr:protein NPAT-like isoform X2 [Myxocyprinus asiaticus]
MLLPSDVARLVLGYLQQEGLTATSRTFIFESPNLKEYAEHSSEDGVIPACMFSLFGKNLITILNEYVAVNAKETSQENQIPAVMTSLWKKLEFTLNQIKSLQNSPTVQINQRLRTISSIQSMRPQQRPLSALQSPLSGNLPVTPAGQCVSPVSTPQGMLGHSTPMSYTAHHTRPSTLCLSQSGESPLQILVPDQRLNPGPLSPARRKCDSPRRRGGGQLGASGTSRSTVVSSTLIVETQCDESVAENLSQIVIENARDKILNDRSLQEKLAENINKILASDNSPQTSKAACSTVEQEQSIDEILGLQGEIHMTNDAIQDILAQTESDPAFQALFDLFDYEKSKTPEGSEQADGSFSSSTLESDETGCVDSASETGTGHEDSTSWGEGSASRLRNRNASETKSKKSSSIRSVSKSAAITPQPRTVTKQKATGQGSSNAKRGLLRTRVLSGNKQTREAISTPKLNGEADSRAPDQTVSSSSFLEDGAIMEIDEPQNETSETLNIQHPSLTPPGCSNTTEILNDKSSQHVTVSNKPPQTTSTAEVNKSINETGMLAGMPGGHSGLNLDVTETSVSTIQSEALPSPHLPQPDLDISARMASHTSNKTSLTPSCTLQKDSTHKHTEHNNVRSNPSTASASSAASTTLSTSGVSDAQANDPDPSKFVSLKIIISNEQDEQSNDVALNQAVSSITGDRIPTIFLSSPAKSPAKTLPTSVITQEETAQAVSSLQGPEDVGSFGIPTVSVQSKAQTTPARPTGQETGFIQLLPATTTFGSSSGYFVVTDPAAGDQRSNVVLLPSTVPQGTVSSTPHVVATPPRQRTVVSMGPNVSQAYSPGSTIIISSSVQTMLQNVMVPVSVMGQNTGKLAVLPNQMLTLPCSSTVRQPAKVISQPKLATKENTDMGKPGTSGSSQVSKVLPQTSQSSDLQKSGSGTSPSHRRILCFDVTPENTAAGQSSTETSTFTSSVTTSSPTQQADMEIKRTELNTPLVSDTSKRRIETIRLPQVNHSARIKDSETATIPQQQKEAPKSKVSEKGTDLTANKAPTKPESFNRSDLHKKSQASDKVDGGVVSKSTKLSAQRQKQKPTDNTKDSTQEESRERRLSKPSDQSSEKISSQESPGVTANKENELEGLQREQRQTTSHPLTKDLVSSTVKSAAPVSGTSNKPLYKTSPFTKQAVEMLQDIQCQAPTATPPKRQGPGCPDLPIPRTPGQGQTAEELTDGLRTPSRQRLIRESEGTPRCLALPATPDIPSCSPASEAGSENSINMAAHTLMILSRAVRKGGPLKDSLRQEEASAGKSSAPKGKKRKHIEPSPSAKKELQLSGSSDSKKKSKKQKKLLDSFPDDLDVDKFLSSLHYDE